MACIASFAPTHASAWCRASDEQGPEGECVQSPKLPFLFWKRTCTTYHFNSNFFDRFDMLSEDEIRSSFRAAFDVWAAVDCDGKTPFLVEQLSGTTSTASSEYLRDKPNEMVVLALDRKEWSQLPDHSPRALALTLMWHNKKTGEILDTDMEVNLGAGEFADCVANSCTSGELDFQNTITHEAGHVLGLGHSTDTSATMAAQTVGAVDTQKRSLTPDDEKGYCALELPEATCTGSSCSCSEEKPPAPLATPLRNTAGCQITTPTNASANWAVIAAALACLMPLRRRRTS
jgi:hypothetical protein